MANQIVVSSGAKVRDLNDVIIGTSGVLSSLAFNVSNGVPKLDVNGKILVSQLPNSVMEYLGTWNAATNTPFLVNGTGNAGDVYLCNVAGTVDFGAGPISFVVSDQVIYSGSIWQKASGSNGTVTSVAVTESGDSLNITGSPITTSGTINIGFNGTNLQYINGAGDLTTFPTLLSSVGLSMPSAFSVANSPLTSNGTIAVTGAGYPSQYIRGDGTLADFPTSGGGGSSVSYYLNGGTSQGTIGGVTYYEMSKIAVIGTGVDFPKTGDGLIVSFLTDAGDPAQLNIPAGNWNYEIYASMSANGGTPELYAELYVYDGTTFTLIGTSSNEILYDGTTLNLYTFAMAVPATTLAITDRLAVKLYATNSGGKTTTVHTQDGHLCQIITTFSTGITALNGLTAQVQFFATGTSGTDFAINSSTATHTFNLPVASAANTGKLSSTDWSTFNGKVPYTGATASVNLGNNLLSSASIQLNGDNTSNFGYLGFKQYAGGSSGFNGYTSIFAQGTNSINIAFSATGGSKTISFLSDLISSSTTRSYSLPDADGTIALTSSLSSYLPLAGGTLTGALNGTSAVFSSTVQASAYKLTGMTGGSGALYWSSDRVTLANYNATGVVNIEANGGTSVATFGGATYNNDFVGTLRNTTSAYFATASGNVGIGNSSPSYTLDVSGTGRFTSTLLVSGAATFSSSVTAATKLSVGTSSTLAGVDMWVHSSSATNVNVARLALTTDTTGHTASDGSWVHVEGSGLYISNYENDIIAFDTNATERMRITSGGNVGIGTSSPSYLLTVSNTSFSGGANGLITLIGGGESSIMFMTTSYGADTNKLLLDNATGSMQFRVNSAERMRITSGGDVAIGDTSASGYKFKVNSGSSNPYGVAINYSAVTPNVTGDNQFLICTDTTNTKFAIWSSGTAQNRTGTYGTLSSDLRLKENVIESTSKLNDLLSLRVVNFNFKDDADKKKNIGFIAQEFKEVFPSLVYQRDTREYDKDGNIISGYEDSLSLAVGMEFAILVKAIQEQNQTIQNLQEQINILAK